MIIYDKFSCIYYEKIFDSKNKLHNYIRDYKYQKLLFNKSDIVIIIVLTKLFIFKKNVISNINVTIFIFVIKNLTSYDFNLLSLFIFKTTFNDVIKKKTYFAAIFFFVAKSISFHKFNLLTLVFVESITFKNTITSVFLLSTSLLIYRFVLFLSFIYESYKKLYFTIVDLYIRYASLNKSLFTITRTLLNKSQVRSKITRIIIMLFIVFI